ncbi:ribonuclease P SCDLUD_001308 [Saccharomycodes ludwigii]|uniref:ribonuclease P n=1 Tax=Saccharomycodes ludwigii TaxID=36035 RepID=UPI001E834B74|nr:hypothetical protein SCDLUD_001308 [Saccharomycodes ludwigii]KAH3903660.1 hypothetical protein SCDLUD_001308 [Saccharomycodes ludwigii]
MHFRNFKLYSKGYHSATHKQATTTFFDSTYHYIKKNRTLLNSEAHAPPLIHGTSNSTNANVLAANVNYNNIEHILATNHNNNEDDNNKVSDENTTEQGNTEENIVSEEASKTHATKENDLPSEPKVINNANSARCFFSSSSPTPGATEIAPFKVTRERRASFNVASTLHSKDLYTSNKNQKLIFQEKLSKNYYSTAATLDAAIENLNKKILIKEPQPAWEADTEVTLNKAQFLKQTVKEIDDCLMNKKDYNKIYSLYNALKRNDIVPSVEVYSKIIKSLCIRDLDSKSLDDKMFNLLNCYQDIINNKIKPTPDIYDQVIKTLFDGSIIAFKTANANGTDFFKIATELFQTVQAQKLNNPSQELLENFLLAVSLYPGFVSIDYIFKHITPYITTKNSDFYIPLFHYAKLCNDYKTIKLLYEEFRSILLSSSVDNDLRHNQYKVYAVALAGLVECGQLRIALKLLDGLILEIRQENGSSENIEVVLSNFLISFSKINPEKAYNLWFNFKKLSWIPEFSYEFYLSMLGNCLGNWPLAVKIYDYLFSMERSFRKEDVSNKTDLLVYPFGVESILSSFMDYSLQLNDTRMVLKLLEESIIKSFKFEIVLYPHIFDYLKNKLESPDSYLLRLVESHGSSMNTGLEKFEFLNSLVDKYHSQVILNKVGHMPFFMGYCKEFDTTLNYNYAGVIAVFQAMWCSPQTVETYVYSLEIHALIVSEFNNLDHYFTQCSNEVLLDFKEKITERFKKLIINYKRMHLDPTKLSDKVVQLSTRVLDIPEIDEEYFLHLGDWDKSYPISLGGMIRTTFNTGIKEFQRLSKEGYCFDFDTYNALITKNIIDSEIITKAIELVPSNDALRAMCNTLVVNSRTSKSLMVIANHPLFSQKILVCLKDYQLQKIAHAFNDNIHTFIKLIDFPDHFKSITLQAEYKETVNYIYEMLFNLCDYKTMLKYNKILPILDTELLLKTYIRGGDYEKFISEFSKYKKALQANVANDIWAEYLINNKKFEEALETLAKSGKNITPHKTNDLRSYILFNLSLVNEDFEQIDVIENTLQLANVLCSMGSYHDMILVYQEYFSDLPMQPLALKKEILDQMLNNFESSLQFDQSSKALKNISDRLKNYFRFKRFLGSFEMSFTELSKILHIWSLVSPKNIPYLFNNVVESIYINSLSTELYIMSDFVFRFKPAQLSKLLSQIRDYFIKSDASGNITKIDQFMKVVSKLYGRA